MVQLQDVSSLPLYYLVPGLLVLATPLLLFRARPSSASASSDAPAMATTAPPPPAHTVVVLGAGFVGVPLVHHLLKHTPAGVVALRVVLVAPNDALYWNSAAPRGFLPTAAAAGDKKKTAAGPGFGNDKLFYPLAPALAPYAADGRFTHVVGRATAADLAGQTVEILLNKDGTRQTVPYDTLVVATGTDFAHGLPFKTLSSSSGGGGTSATAATAAALDAMRARIAAAGRVVVAGGGSTGVELAGELGAAYAQHKTKDVVLLVREGGGPLAGTGVQEAVQKEAASRLARLGVRVLAGTEVTAAEEGPDGGKTVLTLETREGSSTLEADVYVPAFGLVYNTQFLPPHLLDGTVGGGRVHTRPTLQAEGYDNVFVAGDAAAIEPPSIKAADSQLQLLAPQLQAYLRGWAAAQTAGDKTGKEAPVVALKTYTPSRDLVIAVSLGPGGGTGQMGSFRLFSFLVWLFKSRYMGTNVAPDYAAGKRTLNNTKW